LMSVGVHVSPAPLNACVSTMPQAVLPNDITCARASDKRRAVPGPHLIRYRVPATA
jgi:hypothetical protein